MSTKSEKKSAKPARSNPERFKLLLSIAKRDLMPYTLTAKEAGLDRNSLLCAALRAYAVKPAQLKDAARAAKEDNGNTKRSAWQKMQQRAKGAKGVKGERKAAAKVKKTAKKPLKKSASVRKSAANAAKPSKPRTQASAATSKRSKSRSSTSGARKRSTVTSSAEKANKKHNKEVAKRPSSVPDSVRPGDVLPNVPELNTGIQDPEL